MSPKAATIGVESRLAPSEATVTPAASKGDQLVLVVEDVSDVKLETILISRSRSRQEKLFRAAGPRP